MGTVQAQVVISYGFISIVGIRRRRRRRPIRTRKALTSHNYLHFVRQFGDPTVSIFQFLESPVIGEVAGMEENIAGRYMCGAVIVVRVRNAHNLDRLGVEDYSSHFQRAICNQWWPGG